jgi:hypothetical protein
MAKKIEKLLTKQDIISSDLVSKSQELKSFFNDRYNWKSTIVLAETEWVPSTPYFHNSIQRSAYVGTKLNSNSNIIPTFLDFDCPESMIPFVNVEILTKCPPQIELAGVSEVVTNSYTVDYFEIYGNGSNLIYKGFYPPQPYQLKNQSELTNGDFQESYTKRVYNADITYTDGGQEYRVIGILYDLLLVENTGMSPDGNQEFNSWDGFIDPFYASSKNYAKYTALSATQVSMQSKYSEVRYIPNVPPPGEQVQITITDNVAVTKNFSSMSSVTYRIKSAIQYIKVGGVWMVSQYGSFDIASNVHTISVQRFTFQGFWLFWDSQTSCLFSMREVTPLVLEGSSHKVELYNFPVDPWRLWSYILFKRNHSPYPLLTTGSNLQQSERQLSICKNFKTTDVQKINHKLCVSGTLIFNVPATKNPNIQVIKYTDTYSQDPNPDPASKYLLTIQNHDLLDLTYFNPDDHDIEYKIRVTLTNPFYFDVKHTNE